MIPKPLLQEILADHYYKKCCITGRTDGKIELHHNLLFKGRQVQERFAILPVHISIHQYHKGITSEVKEQLNRIMVSRMTDEQIDYYSKAVNYRKYK